jgi:Ca2+-transporting ATPase
VHATGIAAEIGRIGKSLASIDPATPRLSLETRRLVRLFALAGMAASVAAAVIYGLLRGSWLDAALAGIALGMSMLPEEFPLVLAVFMTMGAWRISQARVLTRRAAAIEALGAATVLCTDKTGTLTRSEMSVAECLPAEGLDAPILLRWGSLACAPEAFDPMDRAIARAADAPDDGRSLVRGYALSTGLLAVTQVWRLPGASRLSVAAKGAPEAIMELCRLDPAAAATIRATVEAMAGRGMRMLGVAHAEFAEAPLPETPRDYAFKWAGLVGLADPLRPEVPDAIAECRSAGIRVVMITGDYPTTARAIARAAGLPDDPCLRERSCPGFPTPSLRRRVGTVSVFARILPEQKLRIVEALQSNGEVVAMTGDGVNDAPSLKRADYRHRHGRPRHDVAREASSIVLLDDDFGSVVRTVRLGPPDLRQSAKGDGLHRGRARTDRRHRAAATADRPAAGPVAGAHRLPRDDHRSGLLDRVRSRARGAGRDDTAAARARCANCSRHPCWCRACCRAWAALLATSAVYLLAVQQGLPDEDVRVLSFFTLVLSNLALVVAHRSHRGHSFDFLAGGNPVLLGIHLLTGALLALVVAFPPARALFGFGVLHADDVLTVALAVGVLGLVLAAIRQLHGRADRRRG